MFVAKVGMTYAIMWSGRNTPQITYTYNIAEATTWASEEEARRALDPHLPPKEIYTIVSLALAMGKSPMDASMGKAVDSRVYTGPTKQLDAEGPMLAKEDTSLQAVVEAWARKEGRKAEAQALQSAIFELQKRLGTLQRNT